VGVIVAIWIEKGVGMVVTGFVPNPLGRITDYAPTSVEIGVTAGVYAFGFMVLTLIYKIVVNVRERMLAA
jgi:molybdopterin-containing oxidoreductase family membrane subunit